MTFFSSAVVVSSLVFVCVFGATLVAMLAMLFVAALSVSDAMFLILELDTPYGGLIRISSKAMDSALEHLGH